MKRSSLGQQRRQVFGTSSALRGFLNSLIGKQIGFRDRPWRLDGLVNGACRLKDYDHVEDVVGVVCEAGHDVGFLLRFVEIVSLESNVSMHASEELAHQKSLTVPASTEEGG